MRKLLIGMLCLLLLLSACDASQWKRDVASTQKEDATTAARVDLSGLIGQRSQGEDYEEDRCAMILLEGDSAQCASNAVTVADGRVTVTDEGCYVVTGTLSAGMLIIDAQKEDEVRLILRDAAITSSDSAAVYIRQAKRVCVTLEGKNRLENGGVFEAVDENNIDGALFSKEELTLGGEGSLQVLSPAGHGLVCKDSMVVEGGIYQIQCAGHGMAAKDSLAVAGGQITVEAGKDGLHGEDSEDASLGNVYIADGSFLLTAEGDGISAGAAMQIDGGSFTMCCGGGAENGAQKASQSFGGPGGKGLGGMGPGGRGPGGMGAEQTQQTQQSEEDTSAKGLKAGGALRICGGSFVLHTADDGIHANGALTVEGGVFSIATGDDGFHADEALLISGGQIEITESYEGLEGLSVTVSGGDIAVKATDDGINAAGGSDGSGFAGPRGNDRFGDSSQSDGDCFILISGGTVSISASGDGLDSNGKLQITGGATTVCGPTQGDTAVLDYDRSGIITGGSFIGTGAYMMAQSFSDSEQGVIALQVGDQAAGTVITLRDEEGALLLEHSPALSYAIVILSTPEIEKGQTYTVTVGALSGSFAAD